MAKLKSNSDQLTFEKNYDYNNNIRSLRILIFSESFYPYTSGISRRFIEIITRLAKKSFRIHVVTGTRVRSTKHRFCLFNFLNVFF